MDELSGRRLWTFLQGGDELTVEERLEGDRVVVTLTRSPETGAKTVRACVFRDQSAAAGFHADLGTSLLKCGWVFVGHMPERRARRDRRHLLRKTERRQWWTDGGTFLE